VYACVVYKPYNLRAISGLEAAIQIRATTTSGQKQRENKVLIKNYKEHIKNVTSFYIDVYRFPHISLQKPPKHIHTYPPNPSQNTSKYPQTIPPTYSNSCFFCPAPIVSH